MLRKGRSVTVDFTEALTEIRQFNGYRTTTIYAELDSKQTTPKELFNRFNKKYQNISKSIVFIRNILIFLIILLSFVKIISL